MLTRFENVNVIETLRKIMRNITEYYHSDFEYDIAKLQRAAEDSHGNRHFLLMFRQFGTWCFEERDVYIHNTHANNTWILYKYSNENTKTFAVEIKDLQNKDIIGHVFEMDYKAHIDDIRKNSLNAQSIVITDKHPDGNGCCILKLSADEYNNNWYSIGKRYGEIGTLSYEVADEQYLQDVLCKARQKRILNSVAGNLDEYIDKIVKDRFHTYGYTEDDMVFTKPRDAFDALENKVPVYMLSRDNTKKHVISTNEINYHIFHRSIFGMKPEDKRLLEYLIALPENRVELFNQAELQQIYTLALAAGQSGDLDKNMMKAVETIVNKLDRVLPVLPEAAESEQELDEEMEV